MSVRWFTDIVEKVVDAIACDFSCSSAIQHVANIGLGHQERLALDDNRKGIGDPPEMYLQCLKD